MTTSGRRDAAQELTSSTAALTRALDAFTGQQLRASTLERIEAYYRLRDSGESLTDKDNSPIKIKDPLDADRAIPAWIDGALRKAVHPDPNKRYEELSEFLADLRRPNEDFLSTTNPPLIERNPLLFWKSLSFLLGAALLALLLARHS